MNNLRKIMDLALQLLLLCHHYPVHRIKPGRAGRLYGAAVSQASALKWTLPTMFTPCAFTPPDASEVPCRNSTNLRGSAHLALLRRSILGPGWFPSKRRNATPAPLLGVLDGGSVLRAALALSSTAIVMRILADRKRQFSPRVPYSPSCSCRSCRGTSPHQRRHPFLAEAPVASPGTDPSPLRVAPDDAVRLQPTPKSCSSASLLVIGTGFSGDGASANPERFCDPLASHST
jgi:hypothetical protein